MPIAQSNDYPQWARKHLGALTPYVPGKPIQEVARELGLKNVIKLASNENLLGPSPRAVAAAAHAAKSAHYYPEDTVFELRRALAVKLKVKPQNLLFGNGSDECLHLCATATLGPDTECIYPLTSFVMYPILTAQFNSTGVGVGLKDWVVDLDTMREAITTQTRLVFIPNPNNPTGTVVKDQNLKKFLEDAPPHVLVVVDEAYREIRGVRCFDPIPLALKKPNVVVTRTFSKSYALAGLRVGYAVAHADTIALLGRLRPPFNVNSAAQAAALAALQDEPHLAKTVALMQSERPWLATEVKKLGVRVVPSQANFLMLVFDHDVSELVQGLLHQGVIVRGLKSFGVPGALRVTLGKRKDNQRFLRALKQCLG